MFFFILMPLASTRWDPQIGEIFDLDVENPNAPRRSGVRGRRSSKYRLSSDSPSRVDPIFLKSHNPASAPWLPAPPERGTD